MVLVGLVGVTLAYPSRPRPTSVSAKDLDEEQLRETVNLIEKFIPPIFQAINDDNGDITSRLHKIVDSSLLLSREALKVKDPSEKNQEELEEVQAARETMPLILDIMRATFKTHSPDNNPSGNFDFDIPSQ
ncbi:hypothetical protein E2C01_064264 [Portunus trituberculatus]|uniref:Uncharacterized protein n=2 Tax=Portunus trituberculatus TaxID=210409 RepID=A0A5B7HJX6_PORTR|nr:hypothetical protein [Portunus trituberculatus]